MNVIKTKIPGVLLLEPVVYADERGFFLEVYHQKKFADIGIAGPFVQHNRSRSKANVLRGFHAQIKNPQGKLVYVTEGTVFDVAVDIRPNSPTFGQWVSAVLSGENKHMFYLPPGIAHGFYVQSERADFEYKCQALYDPADETTLLWNDPALNIAWPTASPHVSDKDQKGLPLAAIKEKMMATGRF